MNFVPCVEGSLGLQKIHSCHRMYGNTVVGNHVRETPEEKTEDEKVADDT